MSLIRAKKVPLGFKRRNQSFFWSFVGREISVCVSRGISATCSLTLRMRRWYIASRTRLSVLQSWSGLSFLSEWRSWLGGDPFSSVWVELQKEDTNFGVLDLGRRIIMVEAGRHFDIVSAELMDLQSGFPKYYCSGTNWGSDVEIRAAESQTRHQMLRGKSKTHTWHLILSHPSP